MLESFLQHLISVYQACVNPAAPIWTLPMTGHWLPPERIHSIHFWTAPIVRNGIVKVSPDLFPCSFSSLTLLLSSRESSYWMASKLHLQSHSLQGRGGSQTLGWSSFVKIVSLGRCLNLACESAALGLIGLLWKWNEVTDMTAPGTLSGTEKTLNTWELVRMINSWIPRMKSTIYVVLYYCILCSSSQRWILTFPSY